MKHVSLLLLCALAATLGLYAQDASVATASRPDASQATKQLHASLQGIVTKDPGSEPVKKALIELIAENQNERGNYTAVTDAEGHFHIEGVVPGRYRLFAERTGYLEVDSHHRRTEGLLLSLSAGQEVRDLVIHLQASAIVEGRVTDEDGDPMPDAGVAVLRQTFASGRSRWEQVGGERTNDLGEYRIAGLAAGTYYISVTPAPDLKRWIETASKAEPRSQSTVSPNKSPPTSYTKTYYPGTRDRSQAAPVQLHGGDDFPANFSLTRGPSLAIRGSVALPPGASAMVMAHSADMGMTLSSADVGKDGSFEIADVSPGSYTLVATVTGGSVAKMARQTVQVVSSDAEGVRLVPQSGGSIRGYLRLESKNAVKGLELNQLSLALTSADGDADMLSALSIGEGFAGSVRVTADVDVASGVSLENSFSPIAHVNPDGSFGWKNVPPGRYFIQPAGDGAGSSNWFLKSVLAAGREVKDTGVTVAGGAAALDVIASTGVAVIDGTVVNSKGEAVANAVVVAAPEARLRSRTDYFHKTVTDQSGHFILRGVTPGAYTLFAWESVDGDDYYNPEFLRAYKEEGTALSVSEGEQKSVQLKAASGSDQQP